MYTLFLYSLWYLIQAQLVVSERKKNVIVLTDSHWYNMKNRKAALWTQHMLVVTS